MGLSLSIVGAKGRMGLAIASAAEAAGHRIAARVDAGDTLSDAFAAGDVVIDFSFHQTTRAVLELAVRHRRPLVIGTTGHSAAEKRELAALASQAPCVWAGNYSVGVNLLFALTQRAAAVLGSDYDCEVVEMHHRFKKDAPSGTAARLLEIILEERRLDESALRHGRSGIVGERSAGEVGVHALRGGDVAGDHTVLFAGVGERLELTHKASDRSIFARGAIRAAEWISDRPAGLHDMQDVLGLRSS
ncbi:MAG: 4-hydroxy-tetrahydrodipicolinate reductase [Verrucomicrobia bacterium]|nr:4-hydroxy-tetrahydrodipicolinate reductase [Verrucomicrobiota bacterium]